ncbi:MAG: HAMP domain-containing histidine kinase [Armatimonadetes bacterium]|nr:HAMP domain-containing histidine kinase [Armatimonadota bacterium]
MPEHPELSKKLSEEAHRELARRSLSGTWAYFLVVLVAALGTPYYQDYPLVLTTTVVLATVVGVLRLWVASSTLQNYARAPEAWRRRLRWAIYLTPVVWGFFLSTTMVLYGQAWTSALVMVLTAGIAAGATAAFNPDFPLVRGFQVILWVPAIVVCLTGRGGGFPVALLASIYLGYLLWQGKVQNRDYWRALEDREMLRIQTERLEETHRIKDEFLAVVTHDLRNALQGMMLYSNLVRRRARDPELVEMGNSLRESGKYMNELVNDLHDLARLGMKAIRLAPEEVDVQDIIARVIEEQNQPAGEQKVELRRGPTPAVKVVADRVRLRQILANLVSNAIKYNRQGGWVEVRTRQDGENVIVEVEDSGIGIEPEQQHRVFELFSRVHEGRIEGSGLGLAITRQLVELHEGSLELESSVEKGSTFRVRLPLGGPRSSFHDIHSAASALAS